MDVWYICLSKLIECTERCVSCSLKIPNSSVQLLHLSFHKIYSFSSFSEMRRSWNLCFCKIEFVKFMKCFFANTARIRKGNKPNLLSSPCTLMLITTEDFISSTYILLLQDWSKLLVRRSEDNLCELLFLFSTVHVSFVGTS